ncbi:hypothetical protein EIK77_002176 [Talaromyces pinophilus]|nr:hypothetical protein EIK77_002176 [Talaromyces pinophilus]
MDYSSYYTLDPEMRHWDPILGPDGKLIYEDVWGSLKRCIVANNDVATLKNYAAKHPRSILFQDEFYYHDLFYVAASSGALDALRALLDFYHANPERAKYLETRPFSMVEVACGSGSIDMVNFLLDDDPLRETVYASEYHGGRALLCATQSLGNLSWGEDVGERELREYINKSEKLINMLLDRGASVREANRVYQWDDVDEKYRLMETALRNAMKHGSYKLLSRLIANGADVHARQWSVPNEFGEGDREVTALHLGSGYWNLEGIQAVLDNRGEVDLADIVSMRDDHGRLSIHWAAAGFDDQQSGHVCDGEDCTRCISIMKLLIDSNPRTVNVQDNEGKTALFYALERHSKDTWVTCHCLEEVTRFLCEHGADASIQDHKGQSVLYHIGATGCYIGWSPINRAILDILVAHGGRVNDADEEGDTALHILTRWQAKWLKRTHPNRETHEKQMKTYNTMVKYFREIGGSMDQRNKAGETPQQLLDDGYRNEGTEKPPPRPAGRGRGRGHS